MTSLALAVFICLSHQWFLVFGKETEYTNKWVAEIPGGEEVAQRIARDLGYNFGGQIASFKNHYLLTRDDHPEVSLRDSQHLTKSLSDLDEVKWARQQKIVQWSKRGYIPQMPVQTRGLQQELLMQAIKRATGGNKKVALILNIMKTAGYSGDIAIKALGCLKSGKTLLNCGIHLPEKLFKHFMGTEQGDTNHLGKFSTQPLPPSWLKKHKGVTKNVGLNSKKVSAYGDMFNDPLWKKQWYMQDYRTEEMPVMDHNIVPVYKMDITGKGITVAVVDDGVAHDHPDLEANFDVELSYNICQDTPGSNPSDMGVFTNSHGTECAGEIAMVANNEKCGVGVAYDAKVAGVLSLCAKEDEVMESKSLQYRLDKMDIYSCSWGPNDDGKTLRQISELTDLALFTGINEGREKKGAIYVFASGNGKSDGDNCGTDYIVNHIATIPIASASQKGKVTFYSERCTAIFATAYSGGGLLEEDNSSVNMKGACTTRFSGTSASVPLASGIIALTLQANPKLTYRDIMHLIAVTSEVAPLAAVKNTWYKNGKGFWVSNDFGFGLLNAENMVTTAQSWKNVPEKTICTVTIRPDNPEHLSVKKPVTLTVNTKGCQEAKAESVKWLEQVEVIATIEFPVRGSVSIEVTSPSGTKTTVLEPRKNDHSKDGYNAWPIMSVHNWGEDPKGKWTILVKAHDLRGIAEHSGYVNEITLKFHGTNDKPNHYPRAKKLRKYSPFRLHNGKTSES